jgi:hypothetical protein
MSRLFFDDTTIPNNWIFNIPENEPLPYVNFITDNFDEILNTNDDIICIRCSKNIIFEDNQQISNNCMLNTVFCPDCNTNMLVPKSKIPEPYQANLSKWHMLAFGMFANRPISDEEYDSDEIPELEEPDYSNLSFYNLTINNKDKIINDFLENHGGGVCLWCYNKMDTLEDIDYIKDNSNDSVSCSRCTIKFVLPISEIPEPFEDNLNKMNKEAFGE